jgi:hypothetical protein
MPEDHRHSLRDQLPGGEHRGARVALIVDQDGPEPFAENASFRVQVSDRDLHRLFVDLARLGNRSCQRRRDADQNLAGGRGDEHQGRDHESAERMPHFSLLLRRRRVS